MGKALYAAPHQKYSEEWVGRRRPLASFPMHPMRPPGPCRRKRISTKRGGPAGSPNGEYSPLPYSPGFTAWRGEDPVRAGTARHCSALVTPAHVNSEGFYSLSDTAGRARPVLPCRPGIHPVIRAKCKLPILTHEVKPFPALAQKKIYRCKKMRGRKKSGLKKSSWA